jgi:hypothetical protein
MDQRTTLAHENQTKKTTQNKATRCKYPNRIAKARTTREDRVLVELPLKSEPNPIAVPDNQKTKKKNPISYDNK